MCYIEISEFCGTGQHIQLLSTAAAAACLPVNFKMLVAINQEFN